MLACVATFALHGVSSHEVTVEVDVPVHLTPEQRDALEALARATTDDPRKHLKEVNANG